MADTRTRQDIWKLETEKQWHPITVAYALAVGEMQKRSAAKPDDPTGWAYQATVHAMRVAEPPDKWRSQCQHNSWFFLPWHRMYLYWFEEIVRSVVQTLPDVDATTKREWALPYWNYDRRGTTNTLPPAFRTRKLPNNKDNPLYVEKRNTTPGLDLNAGDGLPDGRDGGPSATTARFAMRELLFSMKPQEGQPAGFGGPETKWHHYAEDGIRTPGNLESAPHNVVHNLVGGPGGWMSDLVMAGLDPIFWLHHANIDRLWAVWLTQTGRTNPSQSTWLKMTFHFHDSRGDDVTRQPHDVEELKDLGYTYADISLPPGPQAPEPEAAPPPKHPAELVGATEAPVRLTGGSETLRFGITAPAGPLGAEGGAPTRVYLNVEDIRADKNPGTAYAVYANVPGGQTQDEYYVGNISFFGIEEMQRGYAEHGLRQVFDITDVYTALRDRGEWNENEVTVTFVPIGPAGGGPGPAGAEPTPPVTVGRVSLFYQ
jgi:tyrosinase